MTPEEIAENEYEMEMFGVSSQMVISLLKAKIENDIMPYFPDQPEQADNAKSMTKAIEETFREFQLPTKQMFAVPRNISLMPHLALPEEDADVDPKTLEAEVNDLEETHKQHILYMELLKNELQSLDRLEEMNGSVDGLIATYKNFKGQLEQKDKEFRDLEMQLKEVRDDFETLKCDKLNS